MRAWLLILTLVGFSCLHSQNISQKLKISYPNTKVLDKKRNRILVLPGTFSADFPDSLVKQWFNQLPEKNRIYYMISDTDPEVYSGTITVIPFASTFMVTWNYTDGMPKRTGFYNSEGKKISNHSEFWPNGAHKEYGRYSSDKKDGTWKYFDTLGRMTRKEKWELGKVISEKSYVKPRRLLSEYLIKGAPAVPYKIRDTNSTAGLAWIFDERAYKQTFAFGWGYGYIQRPFSAMNDSAMLDLPSDDNGMFHIMIQVGNPKKLMLQVQTGTVARSKTGDFRGESARARISYLQTNVSVSYGIVNGVKSGVGLFAGAGFARATFSSEDLSDTDPTGQTWFELSFLRQYNIIHGGIFFDHRFQFAGPWTTGFSIRAGYDYALSDASWHLYDTPLQGKPEISMSGLYVSASLKFCRLRKVIKR